jgi:flagellar biosynthesis/type III secretory pathway protein FliH
MGHIVKAGQGADSATVPGCANAQPSDAVAAEVTRWLLAARVAADAERIEVRAAAVLLARKMAEKIVGHAVDLDPSVMADIADQALAASRARGACVVLRVHPDDLAAVEQARPRWLERGDGPGEVRLIGDASVGRYGCVVETPVGRIDARLQTQLDWLERVLDGGSPRP